MHEHDKEAGALPVHESPAAAVERLAALDTPMALRVTATLGIADLIADGVSSSEALARCCEADPGALRRLMRYLTCRGIFTTTPEGDYELTQLGECLRDGHPSGVRGRLDFGAPIGRAKLAVHNLLDAVKFGMPTYSRMFGGTPFYEDLALQGLLDEFDRVMGRRESMRMAHLLDACDWTGVHHVVDVGGGSGALLTAILGGNADMRGTVLETPATAPSARRTIEDAGLAERCDVVDGSFFDPLPAGADCYIVSSVLHDWPDEQAAAILRRCAEAADTTGRVLVMGRVPATDELPHDKEIDEEWLHFTRLDLFELTVTGGRERTLSEYRALAEQVGLTLELLDLQIGPNRVMECTRRASA